LSAQKHQNFGPILDLTSQLDREYLWKSTRYHQTENGIANCNHSHTCTLNLVNFGLQIA